RRDQRTARPVSGTGPKPPHRLHRRLQRRLEDQGRRALHGGDRRVRARRRQDPLHLHRAALERGGHEKARGDGLSPRLGNRRRPAGSRGQDHLKETGMTITSITPFLWFDTQAEDAAKYYVSLFPNSRILQTSRYGDFMPDKAGQVMVVELELMG